MGMLKSQKLNWNFTTTKECHCYSSGISCLHFVCSSVARSASGGSLHLSAANSSFCALMACDGNWSFLIFNDVMLEFMDHCARFISRDGNVGYK